MLSKTVDADSLAVFFLLERELEPKPEAFRCQPHVRFVIPFEAYISFVELYLSKADYLATPTAELQRLTREYRLGERDKARKGLFSAFLKDMSFAVCKELHFAEALGKGATSIVHSSSTGVTLSREEIDHFFANGAARSMDAVVQRLSCNEYGLPPQISAQNAHLYKYACVLNFFSGLNYFYWSYQ